MNRTEAEKLVSDYTELVKRATDILNDKGPPWGYVGQSEFSRLTFEGDDAIITAPEASSYYDSVSIEAEEHRFPATLLFMSPDELKAWKTQALAEYERGQAEQKRQRLAAQEAVERKSYEELKRKFESR